MWISMKAFDGSDMMVRIEDIVAVKDFTAQKTHVLLRGGHKLEVDGDFETVRKHVRDVEANGEPLPTQGEW